MQKHESDGVVISCDFCGSDWDQIKPMVEGHRGSVLCLSCLAAALDHSAPAPDEFKCTLCRREPLPADLPRWFHPTPDPAQPGLNPDACACQDCLHQAARAFTRDKDTDFTWTQPNS